jgi:decaprenylphospho-beta-D-erythro-pentofuranosid-2-ulose 2-reductase
MKNGVGVSQNIVLFGGTSDIGQAIVERLVVPGTASLVLASRNIEAAVPFGERVADRFDDLDVHHISFNAADAAAMSHVVDEVVRESGDIDIAVVAQGVLAEGVDHFANQETMIEVANVNFTATMALLYSLANVMRRQGYGKIVLLSSVAGERVRKQNPAYGASKAGIDGFALALDHDLEGTGVSILVVRPGFVQTKMTAGMEKVPFSTTAGKVADVAVKGIASDKKVVWAPGLLQWMFLILKNLPLTVWRKLPI